MASLHPHKRPCLLSPLEHQREFELLLHDPSRMPYFLDFLMDLGGHNLLMFWLEAEQFAEYTGNARECLDRARGMVERHLGLSIRDNEVNGDSDDVEKRDVHESASSRSVRARNTALALTRRVRQKLRQAVYTDGGDSSSTSGGRWCDAGREDNDDEWSDYGAGGCGAGCSMLNEDEDVSIDLEEDAVVGDRWGRYGAQSKPKSKHRSSLDRRSGAQWRLKVEAHNEATARLSCATVNLFAEAQALAGAQLFRDWYFDFLQSSCARRLAEFLAKAAPLRPTTSAAVAQSSSSSPSASPHLPPTKVPPWACDALLDDPLGPTRRVLERYLSGLDQGCGLQLRDLLGCANESQLNPEIDHPQPARAAGRNHSSRRSSVITSKLMDSNNPAASFRAALVRARDVLRPSVPPPAPPAPPTPAPSVLPPTPAVKASPVSPKDAIFARLNAAKASKKAGASGAVPPAAPSGEAASGANGKAGAATVAASPTATPAVASEEQPGGGLEETVAALAHLHLKCHPSACNGLDLAKAIGKVSDPVTQVAYASVHEDAASFLASVQELHDAAVARKQERLNALRAHLTGDNNSGSSSSGTGGKSSSRQNRRNGSRRLHPAEGDFPMNDNNNDGDDDDEDDTRTSPLSASAASPMYSAASQEPPFRPMLKHSVSVDYFPKNGNGSFSSSIDRGSMDSFREKDNNDSGSGGNSTSSSSTSGIRRGLTRAYRRNSTSNLTSKSSSSGTSSGRSRRNSTSAQLAKQIARLRRFRPNSFRVPMLPDGGKSSSSSGSGGASTSGRRITPALLNKDKYRVGPGHVPPSVRWRRAYKKVRLILMLGGSGGDLEAMFAMRRESHALGIAVVQESLDLFLQERLSNPELIVYEGWVAELHPDNVRRHGGTDSGSDEGNEEHEDEEVDRSHGSSAAAASSTHFMIDHRFYLPGSDHLALWNSHPRVPHECRVQPVDDIAEHDDGGVGDASEESESEDEARDATSGRNSPTLHALPGATTFNLDTALQPLKVDPKSGDLIKATANNDGLASNHLATNNQETSSFNSLTTSNLSGNFDWTAMATNFTTTQASEMRLTALQLLRAYVAVLDAAKLYATQWLRDTVWPAFCVAPESALLSSALHAYHHPHLRARADALAKFRACRLRVRAAQDRALLSTDPCSPGRALLVAEATQSYNNNNNNTSSNSSSGDLGSLEQEEEEDPEPLKPPLDASNDATSLLVAPLPGLRSHSRFQLHVHKQTTSDSASAAICVTPIPSAEQQRHATERAKGWQSVMDAAAELKQQAVEGEAAVAKEEAARGGKEGISTDALTARLKGTLVRSWLIEFQVTAEVYTGERDTSSATAGASTNGSSADSQGNIVGYLVERYTPGSAAAAANSAKQQQQRRPSVASPMSGRSTGSNALGTVCELETDLDHDVDLAPWPQPPQLQSAPERARALFPEAAPPRPPPTVPPPTPPPKEEERLWVFRRRVARCVPVNLRFTASRAAAPTGSSANSSSRSSSSSGGSVRVELEAARPEKSSSAINEIGSDVNSHYDKKVSVLPPAAFLASVQNTTMPTFCAAAHDDPLPFTNDDTNKSSELLRKLNLGSGGVSQRSHDSSNSSDSSNDGSTNDADSTAAPAVIEPTLQSFAMPTEAAEAATAAAAAGVATGYPGLATVASTAAIAAATAATAAAASSASESSTSDGSAASSSSCDSNDSVKQAAWAAVSAAAAAAGNGSSSGSRNSTAPGAVVWGGGLHLGACYTQWRPVAVSIPAHEDSPSSSAPPSPNSETSPDTTPSEAAAAAAAAGGGSRTMYLPSTLCLATEDDPALLPMHGGSSGTAESPSSEPKAANTSSSGTSTANTPSDHDHQQQPIALCGSGAFSAALDLMRAALIDHSRLKATFFRGVNNDDGTATTAAAATTDSSQPHCFPAPPFLTPSSSLVWRTMGDHRSLDLQSLCSALRPPHVLACLQAACLDRTIVFTSRVTSALTLTIPALSRLSNTALLGTPNEPSAHSNDSATANHDEKQNHNDSGGRSQAAKGAVPTRSSSRSSRGNRVLAPSTVGGHVVWPLLPANHLQSLHKRRVAQPSQRYRPAMVGLDARVLALLKPTVASPEPGSSRRSRASTNATRSSNGGGGGGALAAGSSASLEAAALGAARDGLTSNDEDLLALQAAGGLRAPTRPPLTAEGVNPGSPPAANASTSSAGGGGGRRRGSMNGMSSSWPPSASGVQQRPKHLRWVWAIVPNDSSGGSAGSSGSAGSNGNLGSEAKSVAAAIDEARDCAAAAVRGLRSLLHDAMVVDLDDDAIASPATTAATSSGTSTAAASLSPSASTTAAGGGGGGGGATVGIAGLPALPRRVREGFERSLHRAWHRKDLKAAAALLRPPPAAGNSGGGYGNNLWDVQKDDDSVFGSDSEDSDEEMSQSDEDHDGQSSSSSEGAAGTTASKITSDAQTASPDEAFQPSSTQGSGAEKATAAPQSATAALLSPREAIFVRLHAAKAAKKAAADNAATPTATASEAASGGSGKAGATGGAAGGEANSGALKLRKPGSDRRRLDGKRTSASATVRVRCVAEESIAGAATLALARRVLLASALLPMRRFTRMYPNERVVALHRASLLQALTVASPAKQAADKACEAARTRQAEHVPLPPPPRFGRQVAAVPPPPPRALGGSGRAEMSPAAAHAERAATEAVALHMAVLEADRAAAEADVAVVARWAFLRAMLTTASTEALLVSGNLLKLPRLPEA